jgi:hypothetical protein
MRYALVLFALLAVTACSVPRETTPVNAASAPPPSKTAIKDSFGGLATSAMIW